MGEQKLVRVERFEELATGMRAIMKPCGWTGRLGCTGVHVGVLGSIGEYTGDHPSGRRSTLLSFPLIGSACADGDIACVSGRSVQLGLVFRFAEDLGIPDQLAAENDNPYTSRSTVGTNGRDEVVVAAKERTR